MAKAKKFKASAPQQKKTGRPSGARTRPRDQVDARLTSCAKCESTNRTPYNESPHIVEHTGFIEGRPYTRIVYRRTTCADCLQARTDRYYENDPKSRPKD
ncbi:MAG: hypothetical protein QM811_16795 [Pirellulales bacterium]